MKKIIIFLIIFSYIVYPQDTNNIDSNETATNFFNIPAETENDTNEEPAILQDIRNIENRATVSNTGMFIRAVIGFILTLIGIYLVFIYLKNRTKKISGSNEIIRILATTAVAANRYISIIEIADEMYLISISDHNINLIEKIENKDIKDQIRMMYINSKENAVEDSFRERLRNLNSNDNEENKDNR